MDSELIASTLKNWVDKKFIDNIFVAPTTFGYLYGKKRVAESGGRFIVEPLNIAGGVKLSLIREMLKSLIPNKQRKI